MQNWESQTKKKMKIIFQNLGRSKKGQQTFFLRPYELWKYHRQWFSGSREINCPECQKSMNMFLDHSQKVWSPMKD